MERLSGITFQPVRNIRFAVSHAERTDLTDPGYLLPEEYRLGNRVVSGSLAEDQIAAQFIKRLERLSPQAKAKGASAFWEGVAVLPAVDDPATYADRMEKRLIQIANRMKSEYGVQVEHMSIHLDEGTMIDGKPHYNPHAHIILDRTLIRDIPDVFAKSGKIKQKGKKQGSLWTPNASQLAEVQTLVADCLQMQRGLTKEDRKGKPARKHLDHKVWREMQNGAQPELAQQLADELASVKAAAKAENEAAAREIDRLNGDLAKEEEKRASEFLRGFLIGSNEKKASDYSAVRLIKSDKTKRDELIELIESGDREMFFWVLRGGDPALLYESREKARGRIAGDMAARKLPDSFSVDPLVQWNTDGKDLYLLPERDPKQGRLAFTDKGEVIDVRLSESDEVVRAALLVAKQKWPNQPITLTGSPDFLDRARKIAAEEKIIVQPLDEPAASKPKTRDDDGPDLGR